MHIFYDKPFCQIFFDPKSSAVVIHWIGYSQSSEFREACNKSLELLILKNATYMIADNKEGRVVTPEDQQWMLDEWFPKAYENGYRGSAVIMPTNMFRELAVKNIANNLEKGKFIVQYVDNLEDAQQWILSLNNNSHNLP